MKELIFLSLLLQVSSGNVCKTNDEGPAKNAPCVFPFEFFNEEFHSCTNIKDPKGKLWCSTKVNQDGIHVKGYWGFCDLKGKYMTSYQSE